MKVATRFFTSIIAAALLSAVSGAAANAQDRGRVVICPVEFDHGTRTSQETAWLYMVDTLRVNGFTVVPYGECLDKWHNMNLQEGNALATTQRMIRFGAAMHARYVVSSQVGFHSRSIWVDLGPRTCSTATINLKIADVPENRVVYSRGDVKARSDEKFDATKAAADVVFTPLVTAVSGGPKTPHEQRAVEIAVTRVLRGFVGVGAAVAAL